MRVAVYLFLGFLALGATVMYQESFIYGDNERREMAVATATNRAISTLNDQHAARCRAGIKMVGACPKAVR